MQKVELCVYQPEQRKNFLLTLGDVEYDFWNLQVAKGGIIP